MQIKSLKNFALPFFAILSLFPFVSSGMALFAGLMVAVVFGNSYSAQTKKLTHTFLSLAVMGLGAGMNLSVVARVGANGIVYTVLGIASAFILGSLMGSFLKAERNTSLLITVGTAICGGSAIAAVAPVIRAKSEEVSVALGVVFMLNALALFIFPFLGHHFNLSETQFGLWSALAIHDTSSVVGATLQYGGHALEVGTTVKLARALWIIPVAMMISLIRSKQQEATETNQKMKKPWFILGFIVVAALVTLFPSLRPFGHQVEWLAKRLMVLTLFLIGSNLTLETIKTVGIKPFIQGIFLWIIMGTGTLFFIVSNIIK